MRRRPFLGTVTILTAIVPLVAVVGMVALRDVPAMNWFVIYRALIVAGLLVAGVLLIFSSSPSVQTVAFVAWAFFVADGMWSVVVLWPLQDHWPAPLNLAFLVVGAIVMLLLAIGIRRDRTAKGEDIAV